MNRGEIAYRAQIGRADVSLVYAAHQRSITEEQDDVLGEYFKFFQLAQQENVTRNEIEKAYTELPESDLEGAEAFKESAKIILAMLLLE